MLHSRILLGGGRHDEIGRSRRFFTPARGRPLRRHGATATAQTGLGHMGFRERQQAFERYGQHSDLLLQRLRLREDRRRSR